MMYPMSPDTSRLTPGCTHGKIATYSKGCRCDHCRKAWAEYRRDKVRAYRARKRAEKLATHPKDCTCIPCRRDRGEFA
jgi:hypothetical protein